VGIIPVIDLRAGFCSRIIESNYLPSTIYRKDPSEQARLFKEEGIDTIHIVDMDGVFSGEPCALKTAKQLIEEHDISIQMSGGYRSMEDIEKAITVGVQKVILTTAMVRHPKLVKEAADNFGTRIAVGIDVKNQLPVIEGWEYEVDKSIDDLVSEIKELGIDYVIYNDVKSDGSLCNSNSDHLGHLQRTYDVQIVPSGGITSLECMIRLQDLGIEDFLVGKAIYNGKINLAEALKIIKN
jgi:phosphoribosylformimino-5-aminoimidazole carboxamide ribotide isomerase